MSIATAKPVAPGPKPLILSIRSLEAFIQAGLLVLLALMPFHAFLSVWLGSLLGHQGAIQSWKEVLLSLLSGAGLWLAISSTEARRRLMTLPVMLATGFTAVALLVSLVARPSSLAFVFGAKTDLEFLVAFTLAVMVATPRFIRHAAGVILAASAAVIGFGLCQIFLLPSDFLTHFGYGPQAILPYQHITTGVSALRFGSTLGGPNQLGTYLILPLCLGLALGLRRRPWLLALTAGGTLVLVHTYSRSAWIGAAAALALTALAAAPRRWRRPLGYGLVVAGLGAAAALPWAIRQAGPLQYYVLHSSLAAHDQVNSDTLHAASLNQGAQAVLHEPLGHGLGTAGPTAFRTGQGQVIEDYYLQIGYETGLLGMLGFMALTGIVIVALLRLPAAPPMGSATAAALAGISLVALVLPAWTDSSTALITWTTAGALCGLTSKPERGGQRV